MAVDRRQALVTSVPDVRRRVAFLTHGAVRLLDRVHDGLQDIAGALDREQYLAAAAQGRYVVLLCLSVRSLAREGEIDMDGWSASFDFFAGILAGEVASALSLANDALDIDARTGAEWFQRLRQYADDTEALLGLDTPLTGLRSPAGILAFIGMARRWTPLLNELGLPALLPGAWSVATGAEPAKP